MTVCSVRQASSEARKDLDCLRLRLHLLQRLIPTQTLLLIRASLLTRLTLHQFLLLLAELRLKIHSEWVWTDRWRVL